MNDELLYLIPTLLLGLTMAFEIVWVWSARGTVERGIENLDDLIERLKEMEYKESERKLPKFRVGDVVIGNEKAKDYAITKTGFLGIVTAIEGNGLEDDGLMVIKGLKYPNLSYTVQQECFDLFGEQQKTEKPKFKVGDVVVGNKKAKEHGIPVPRCMLIVSKVKDNGCVEVYNPFGNKERSEITSFNTEWLDLVQQQTVDIPETEKPESIMERWANESKNFSETLKNLLKEFGFGSTYQVKYQILSAFSEKYVKLFDKLGTNSCNPDDISVIQLAKALLVVSAYLETDNIEEVIDWADRN